MEEHIPDSEVAEAEERLKKLEHDYHSINEKYENLREDGRSFYSEEMRARARFLRVGYCIDQCDYLAEELNKALGKLTARRATGKGSDSADQSLQFLRFHGCKTMVQENKLLKQKARHQQPDNDEPSQETIDFRYVNGELSYIQRTFPRGTSKNSVMHKLLEEAKEAKKMRDNAIANDALVGNLTSHDSLTKSLENEIKLLKKVATELHKEREETDHMMQASTRAYENFKKKMKRLQERKEEICGRWDEERKCILRLKKKLDEL